MSYKLFLDEISKTPDDFSFEIVELKGRGHPDTLSDTLAARISIDFAKWWMNELSVGIEGVPHHNFDKILLAGGDVNIKWGGGSVVKPFNIIVAGNATTRASETTIQLRRVVDRSAAGVVRKNVGLKAEWNIDLSHLSTSSEALSSTYSQGLFANDTSFGTAHYPLTTLEQTVKDVNDKLEKIMSEKSFLGTDVKIMGRRINGHYVFTLASAIKDSFVNNPEEYFDKLAYLKQAVLKVLPEKSVLNINQNDPPRTGRGTEHYYLLVTGASVECADPGQVGRGNRVTGMITPFRPQTMEAIAGKNLTRHVGGFYNIWAQRIAKKIWEQASVPSQVVIVSEIGKPVQDCHISVSSKQELNNSVVSDACEEVISGYYDYLKELIMNGSEHYPFNYLS